jgi:purine-nucleoside phosphorylase
LLRPWPFPLIPKNIAKEYFEELKTYCKIMKMIKYNSE